jgi:hypothetical protein
MRRPLRLAILPGFLPAALPAALTAALTAALGVPSGAQAQEMGQGHAHITTRSDVRLSLESVPGTSATRLQALGRAVGAGMTALRGCYGTVVEQRPAVHGRMRLRVALAERGAANVEVVEDGTSDRPLLTCVRGVIARQDIAQVERPAAAIVVLEFNNTAAAGAIETARRADEADEVAVSREGGRPSASGEAPGLRFVVRGAADARDELVAEGFRVVRSQIAGMLDCRRRASRREMNPVGAITLRMQMRRAQAPAITSVSSTVEDERAPICLERALERPHRRPELGPATLELEIRFEAGAE